MLSNFDPWSVYCFHPLVSRQPIQPESEIQDPFTNLNFFCQEMFHVLGWKVKESMKWTKFMILRIVLLFIENYKYYKYSFPYCFFLNMALFWPFSGLVPLFKQPDLNCNELNRQNKFPFTINWNNLFHVLQHC